ncbi:uncharacterized protein LOC141859820 isoform X2 [Acropora palmata]|uniref:uncharacterized protein LOC141859820 isoform X2 n=1 Tax=Acropora palmata TaxID=6131 RepID=UPI003DA0F88F
MHRTENNLLWRIVFILVVLTIQGTYATQYGFETSADTVNWTIAATNPSSRFTITTLDESCDLALFVVNNQAEEYWTALRLNEDGKCQWGLNEKQVGDTCIGLLDKVQPGNCYVLSKHSMKLQPRNCSNSYQYLIKYDDAGSFKKKNLPYSDECREYKIRSCLHRETYAYANSSEWKALPYPWSCHEVAGGELIGNCEIRRKAFNCCDYYCRPGNLTYTNNIGGNLSVALQKSPAGFGEKVEFVFKTGDMISLASEVFNNTDRIIAATLQGTEEGMLTWKHSDNYTLRSNVIGVELSPPYNKTLRHLINITYSHAKVPHRDVKRKCVFWQENPGSSNGSWSSHGCSLLNGSSLEKTICTCNHLTSFAVLMQFNSPQKISFCLHRDTNTSRWKALPYPWSCHKVASGELIGNCEIRRKALNCCDYYCRPGNLTYTNNIGVNLSVTVQKLPAGFGEKVEIVFKTGDTISLASEVFNNTERIIAATVHRTEEGMLTWKQSNDYTLRSNVIGVELSPPYNKTLRHLINITFIHAKVPHRDVKRKCVFWQEYPGSSNGSWSSHGCSLLNGSSLEKTICTCNHLTSFAVLMQFNSPQKPISSEDKVALSVITYVGCLLSMMGELLVILVYIVFMKFKAEGIQIRLNLVTALFCAQLVFITGINATHNKSTCVSVAVLLHYLFLASFLWMLLEGVYLYVLIVEVFSTIKVWYLYVFAWGFPIIPVVISLGISSKDGGVLQNYTNPNFCWLSFSNKLSWSFIAPVLIVTLVNVIILVAVLREMRNLKDLNPTRLKSFKKGLKACIILAPLLGLTWVFGLLTATDAGLVFQYIFTILNSTQGLLIFLLHVVRNSDVRAEIHHKLLKWRFERSVNRAQEKSSTSTSRAKQRCCAESRDEMENTQHSL